LAAPSVVAIHNPAQTAINPVRRLNMIGSALSIR
jgi:hypothetical protein